MPYRYQRIEQQLEARRLHDLPSLRALQGDTVSPAALRLLPHLLAAPVSQPLARQAQALLRG
ncbi:penicillin acylase family protein, partial [Diaphorobacter nitroreducens]